MTILDTFFYLFDADARKLEEGVKDADKHVDKLKKNLDGTDKVATMVGGSLQKMAYSFGAALGGILSVGAIAAMTFEVAEFTDEMGDAADAIGVGVDQLHAWELAVQASDGQQGAFTASLNTLNTGMNAIATKGKGLLLPFFKELGLGMKDIKEGAKDPLGAMLKMSDAFSKLSKAEAAGLGSKMGLDQGTINLLMKGRVGVEELIAEQRKLGVITQEDAEKAGKLDLEMKKWNATWATTKREIAMTLIPSLTWFFDKLRVIVNWLTEHKGLVLTFFAAVAAMLIGVYAPAALSAAAATWALIGPYVAVGAAIAAFAAIIALVAEDLYNFQQGNDSVIGELAKKWPIVGDVIHAIGDVLTFLIAAVAAFATSFVTLITDGPEAALKSFSDQIGFLMDEFPAVGAAFDAVATYITDRIEDIVEFWKGLIDAIKTGIGWLNSADTAVGNSQTKIINGARSLFGFEPDEPKSRGILDTGTGVVVPAATRRPGGIGRDTQAGIERGRQQLAATASPILTQSSAAISNSSTRSSTKQTDVKIDRIDVHTQATDGPAVASALSDHLGTQLRGAIDQTDDGVLA